MKIFGLGMPELLIILGVALLIFGPKHLPKLGSALGKTIKNLRSGIAGDDEPETAKLASADDADEEDQPAPQRKKKASRASKEEAAASA